jgi:uncharacterized protein
MLRPTPPLKRLKALYDAVPASTCRGFCSSQCGTVPFSRTEWNYIPQELRKGKTNPDYADAMRSMTYREFEWATTGKTKQPDCQFLQDGRCSIYEYRPMMCRVWGQNREAACFTCVWGCTPTMSYDRIMELMGEWFSIAKGDGSMPRIQAYHAMIGNLHNKIWGDKQAKVNLNQITGEVYSHEWNPD